MVEDYEEALRADLPSRSPSPAGGLLPGSCSDWNANRVALSSSTARQTPQAWPTGISCSSDLLLMSGCDVERATSQACSGD